MLAVTTTTTAPVGHGHGWSHLGPIVVGGLLVAVMVLGLVRTARQRRKWGAPEE